MDIVVVSTLGLLKTKCWGGSRWWSTRAWSSPPPKHIKNPSTGGTSLTENQLETCRRSTQPKLQERSPGKGVERGGGGSGLLDGTGTPGRDP